MTWTVILYKSSVKADPGAFRQIPEYTGIWCQNYKAEFVPNRDDMKAVSRGVCRNWSAIDTWKGGRDGGSLRAS
ncbi:MAG: hypothetical protein JO025_16080 [Verrucomicrobia bacterium]|nr:hypothetical protein [Verrucomicrobiota bacterium]